MGRWKAMKLFENILGLDKIMKKIDYLESTIKKNDEKEFFNENNKKNKPYK